MQRTCSIPCKFKFNHSVGTNYYRLVLNENWIFFYKISFFAAQLVSALRLSALFPRRNFCPVGNLNFKCVAWHITPEFLLDKNSYYKSAFFELSFCNFNFLALRLIAFREVNFFKFFWIFLNFSQKLTSQTWGSGFSLDNGSREAPLH